MHKAKYIPPEFVPMLETWKAPRKPFVLFGAIANGGNENAKEQDRFPELVVLDCSGGHAQPSQVDYYRSKGMCILAWQFPDQAEIEAREKAEPKGSVAYRPLSRFDRNHFAELHHYILDLLGRGNHQVAALEAEKSNLQRELEDLRAKSKGVPK